MKTTTGLWIGSCPRCGHGIAATSLSAGALAKCTDCRATVRLARVTAIYNGAAPCNGECMYARGPKCSCSCGGANHGRGYIAPVGHRPMWVTKRDAERHDAKTTRKAARQVRTGQAAAAKVARFVDAHPLLADLTYPQLTCSFEVGQFLSDMAYNLRKYGELTGRQVDAAERVMRDQIGAAAPAPVVTHAAPVAALAPVLTLF